jgi:transposase
MQSVQGERRPRRSLTKEFKAEVVELVRQPGNTAAGVARDLDLTETAVREWVKQADVDEGRREGLTTAEREELTRLRKEARPTGGWSPRSDWRILRPCVLGQWASAVTLRLPGTSSWRL